jgi:hypothetical protein
LIGNDDKIQDCVGKLDKLTKTEASLVGAETLTESKRTGRVIDDVNVKVTATNMTVLETAQGVATRFPGKSRKIPQGSCKESLTTF